MAQVAFILNDQLVPTDHPERQALLASAYRTRTRPLCGCKDPGLPLYVSKVDDGSFLVKRMPFTGPQHDPKCDCYEIPPELSGRGALGQKAIEEDQDGGITKLRLDFSLSKRGTAPIASPIKGQSTQAPTTKTDPAKLSVRSLLHFLYEDAGLNRWSPRMAGKRNWFVVRKYLLEAAEGKMSGRKAIVDSLLIPEPFSVEHKDDILRRRARFFSDLKATANNQPMGLMIGEVKAFEPARFGHRMIIKHMPDVPIYLADDIYRRMGKNYGTELAFFAEDAQIHLLCITTFTRSATGNLQADTLSLMTVDAQWLPFENREELDLVEKYRATGRYFTKCLRYNLKSTEVLASILLTDTETPTAVYLYPDVCDPAYQEKLDWVLTNSELPYELINPNASSA